MSTTNQAELLALLRMYGRLTPNNVKELQFSDPADFVTLIGSSVSQHNPAYVCTDTVCTVPAAEKQVVLFLCLENLALLRAAAYAQVASMKLDNFQSSKDTPFSKNMALAAAMRASYLTAAKSLGLTVYAGAGGGAFSSETTALDDSGRMAPYATSKAPPAITISLDPDPDDDAVLYLSIQTEVFSQFASMRVYHRTGSLPILDLSVNDPNYPKVRSGSEQLAMYSNQSQRVCKVSLAPGEMTPGTVHRFLVVIGSVSGLYSYSNEALYTVP